MSPKVTDAYREKTRNGIVLAAEKVFARKGYNGASMDDIVEESGLSKGALYGYFKSKEDLFLALRARRIDFDLEQLLAAMPATASATDKLMKVGEVVLRSQALARLVAICCRGGRRSPAPAQPLRPVSLPDADPQAPKGRPAPCPPVPARAASRSCWPRSTHPRP